MNYPETVSPTEPSLARHWLNALRYGLRGRNGVIALIALAVLTGAALNWSWLVALGIAHLLVAVVLCAAMCALGLCMNRTTGGSCSPETRSLQAPKPDARAVASLERGESRLLRADRSTPPDEPTAGPAISLTDPRSPKGADMSKQLRTLAVGAAMAAGLAATPALYAQDDLRMPHGSMPGQGMMGQGGMMYDMMGMAGDMAGMMEHCSEMMQAMNDGHAHRPNDQWRSPAPEQPGQPRG